MDKYRFENNTGKTIDFIQREDGGVTINTSGNPVIVDKDKIPEFLNAVDIVFGVEIRGMYVTSDKFKL